MKTDLVGKKGVRWCCGLLQILLNGLSNVLKSAVFLSKNPKVDNLVVPACDGRVLESSL